jgi:hypothetical protein
MFAIHAFWTKRKSQRTEQISPFCRYHEWRLVSSQPPNAICCLLFAVSFSPFLFTTLLFTRKLCQHWWRKHQLFGVYLTLESRRTILQRDVLETTLHHSAREYVIQSRNSELVLNTWCHWIPQFLVSCLRRQCPEVTNWIWLQLGDHELASGDWREGEVLFPL